MERNDIKAYIETLSYLLRKRDWVSSTDIREHLEGKGIVEGSYDNRRKKVNNYLNQLEYLGYIIRKEEHSGGKNPLKWKINENSSLKDLITLSPKEKNALLLTLSFIPDVYKKLEFSEEIKNILIKANVEFNEKQKKIIEEALMYLPNFAEKIYELDFEKVEKLVEDIINERIIKIFYNRKTRTVIPLKIVSYEGLLYLLGKEVTENSLQLKTFRIGCLNRVGELKEETNLDSLFIHKHERPILSFKEEHPFPFAVEVPSYYVKCEKEEIGKYKIFQTQFHMEKLSNGNFKLYIIGLTSHRFCSHMQMLEIKKIYRPDMKILQLLKEKFNENTKNYLERIISKGKVRELEKNLKLDVYQKRFDSFLEIFKNFVQDKIKAINDIEIGENNDQRRKTES